MKWTSSDLAKEPQGLGLITLLFVVSGLCQGTLCQLTRFRHPARQQRRLTAQDDRARPARHRLQNLLQ
jgi:hypothetical protein